MIEMVTDQRESPGPEMLNRSTNGRRGRHLSATFNTARDRTVAYVKTSNEDMRGHTARRIP